MRRTFVSLTLAVVFCVLALLLSTPYAVRTAQAAAQQPDPCQKCLEKLARDFDKCEEKYGVSQRCYDQFNNDVIVCYATVCEQ
jgi:membrane-bound lytic murein transglycosylase B